ncbi:DUF4326 domain-containing protein [Xanthobacter versatilis]|uniref:DUF4326 domain-containing protein n=1 Tax=Xanthobacter autotrophicus (strain ATCC BAA-1158 / Py2) TaxID=78245 RepID=UPI00372881EC
MADAPRRIQLSRAKGWRLPPNSVKVDRSTKFGNPFVPGKDNPFLPGRKVEDRRHAWRLFQGYAPHNEKLVAAARSELRGKNLACWCPLPEPGEPDTCHAAVLLAIANGPVCEPLGAA